MIVYQKKTYLPEKGLWVSTVAHDMAIGAGRSSETMVFKGDKDGVQDYGEQYFEGHGFIQDEKTLDGFHERIVEKMRGRKE